MKWVGVDACKGGWFAVGLDGEKVGWKLCADFAEVWDNYNGAQAVFVDIPIGLPANETRLADVEARQALPKHLKSTIFNTPVRAAVYAGSKDEAKSINKQLTGKSLSEQSLGIVKKIHEVDVFLQPREELWGRVFESHPETCFGRIVGRFPEYGKKDLLGGLERLRIIRKFVPEVEDVMQTVRKEHPRSVVAGDDILDACILAVSARECDGTPKFIPSGLAEPPRDVTGLPMAVWYHTI